MTDTGMERPDWLPVGWKVTVKARSTGKKDKYYIDPSTGRKFSSRPRVLQYLRRSCKKIQKVKNPVKVEIGNHVAVELPPGWIKKIRTTKSHGRIRRDATYIDPVSGRRFRSKQEVFRFIESKPIRSGNLKSQSRAKARVSRRSIIKKSVCEFAKSGLRNVGEWKDTAMENANMPKGSCSEQNNEVCLAIEFSDNLRMVKRRANNLQREIKKLVDNKAIKYEDQTQTLEKSLTVHGKKLSRRLADIKHEGSKGSMNNNIAKTGNLEGQVSKSEDLKRKWTGELPRRTSQRLACMGAGSSLDGKPNSKSEPLDGPEIDIEKVKSSGLKELPQKGGSCRSSGPRTMKTELLDAPDINIKKVLIVSSSPKELPTKHRPESPTNNQRKKPADETPEKHPESNLENLLMDPCIEFAIKTLTGAIPIEDVAKVSKTMPLLHPQHFHLPSTF